MTTAFGDAVLDFDLNYLHQKLKTTGVENKNNKERKAVHSIKEKIIKTHFLIKKYNVSKSKLYQTEKELQTSKEKYDQTEKSYFDLKEKYKQVHIEYQVVLEKCTKMEKNEQVYISKHQELQDKIVSLENQLIGMQSLLNQFQALVKDLETKNESLRIENQLRLCNEREQIKRTSRNCHKKVPEKYEKCNNKVTFHNDFNLECSNDQKEFCPTLLLSPDMSSKHDLRENEDILNKKIQELQEKLVCSDTKYTGMQSHVNELQVLVKDYELRQNTLTDHICVLRDIVLGKKKLRSCHKKILEKYEKYNTKTTFDDICNSESSNDEMDIFSPSPMSSDTSSKHELEKVCISSVSKISGKHKGRTLLKEGNVNDQDSDSGNEVISEDTGRGSSLAFSDSEKCSNSVDYFIGGSPQSISGAKNTICVDRATSPIKFITVTERATSPQTIKTMEKGTVVHDIDLILKKNNSTSPIKFDKLPSNERQCLESNSSNNLRENNNNDLEIQNILNDMRLPHQLITPIPRSPATSPNPDVVKHTNTTTSQVDHPIAFNCPHAEAVKEFLQSQIDDIRKCMSEIKQCSTPLSSNSKEIDISQDCNDSNINNCITTRLVNNILLKEPELEVIKLNTTSCTNNVKRITPDNDENCVLDRSEIENRNHKNVQVNRNQSLKTLLKSDSTRKLSRLEKLKKSFLPRGKIRRVKSPVIKRVKKKKQKLSEKKHGEEPLPVEINDKSAYEKALKVMAELKSNQKNNPKERSIFINRNNKRPYNRDELEVTCDVVRLNEADIKSLLAGKTAITSPKFSIQKVVGIEKNSGTDNRKPLKRPSTESTEFTTKRILRSSRSTSDTEHQLAGSINEDIRNSQDNNYIKPEINQGIDCVTKSSIPETKNATKRVLRSSRSTSNTADHSTGDNNEDITISQYNNYTTPEINHNIDCLIKPPILDTKNATKRVLRSSRSTSNTADHSTGDNNEDITISQYNNYTTPEINHNIDCLIKPPILEAKNATKRLLRSSRSTSNNEDHTTGENNKDIKISQYNNHTKPEINRNIECVLKTPILESVNETKRRLRRCYTENQSRECSNTEVIEIPRDNNFTKSDIIEANNTKALARTISYVDLDIFTEGSTVTDKHQTEQSTSSTLPHPKESLLCRMLEKYGKFSVRYTAKKMSDETINLICNKIEQGIAQIIKVPQHNTKQAILNFAREIQSLNVQNFLAGFMKYLKDPKRKEELFNKVNTPPAPQMTKPEQILLFVVNHLQGAWSHIDIVNIILNQIEFTLFQLNRTPEFNTVESMSHFYAILCRYFRAKSRLRLFILDAMYCIQYKSVALIKQCLEVWMHILPLAHMGMAKSPLVTCIVYLLHFFKCDDRFNRVQDIRNILSRKYFYQITEWTETKILEMFKNAIREVKDVPMEKKMLRMALIILAKRRGPRWCQKNLVTNMLQPLIEDEKVPDRIKSFCVSVLGPLLKPYPVDMKVNCEVVVNNLLEMLKQNPSHKMKEAIFTSLLYMKKHNLNRVTEALLSWNPRKVSPELENLLKDYVREKPIKVWLKILPRISIN